jgi:polyketide-type polyunsaturated fatty acid synthase PfaA
LGVHYLFSGSDVLNQDRFDEKARFQPIAIIGMGALFAGSRNLAEFWENILNKRDCIQEVPEEYWNADDFYSSDPRTADKTYCKRGGFLPEIEFDAMAFGIPPKTLESISLNQLLALKVANDTLLDAGMIGGDAIGYDKEKVGVILAANIGGTAFPLRERLVGINRLKKILDTCNLPEEKRDDIIERMKAGYIEWTEDSFPGFLPNILAGRIANRFDFGGINFTVDGACAGSLCAIKQSIHELHDHHCDIMLTGGVNVSNDPLSYLSFSKTPALSLKNQIRPYDQQADGMLLGDGLGMLVLKRLEDAEKAGDRIYAVIKGIGSSSDGRAKSIYAPHLKGQIKAIKRAYASAGVSPEAIGLIEGHGTGTVVGDACEIEGLKTVFEPYGLDPQSIALGSVKSQIGHTTQAAGAASTIKAALSLHHKVIPPMINFDTPHPDFKLAQSPFYISSEPHPWVRGRTREAQAKRQAAVSAFGFGGVNLHVILEEHQKDGGPWHRTNRLPRMILLDGSSPESLATACRSLLDQLINLGGHTDPEEFDNLTAPYSKRRIPAGHPRLGFICSDRKEAVSKLETALAVLKKRPDRNWDHPAGIFFRPKGMDKPAKVVALFPGQGSQYVAMGKEIALSYPQLLDAFQTVDKILASAGADPVSDMVFHKPLSDENADENAFHPIEQTRNAQPILAAFCCGLYNILRSHGFQPDICIGHSFGELVALWAGGAFTTKDLYILSLIRGRFMQSAMGPGNDPGGMLAVNHPMDDQLKEMIEGVNQVFVANCNSPDQVVLSGSTQSLDRLRRDLTEKGIKAKKLPVSGAFHSDYMKSAAMQFGKEAACVPMHQLSLPVYSNRFAQPYPPETGTIPTILAEHLHHPVLFQSSIEAIYSTGARVFVEIGPRRILSDLVKATLKDRPVDVISLNPSSSKDSVRQLWEAITRLRVIGVELGGDRYQRKAKADSADNKESLNVVLKGRQYFTPATRKKMAAALDTRVTPKNPPLKSERKKEHRETLPMTSDDSKKMRDGQPQENEPLAAGATDRIIQNHIANSGLQKQFLQNQDKQLALMDKLIDQSNAAAESNNDSRAHTAVHEVFSSKMGHLSRINDQFYHAHLTYMKHQHAILSRMIDPHHKDLHVPHLPGAPDAISGHTAEPSPIPSRVETIVPTDAPGARTLPQSPGHSSAALFQSQKAQDRPDPEVGHNAASKPTLQAFTDKLLSIVTDQTGYPEDMLELDMDIEADLGIDSIKRLEIFSSLDEAFPNASANVELSDLAELKTLQEIIDYFHQHASSADPSDNAATPAGQTHQDADIPVEVFIKTLLSIVTDQTGYPEDMLELDMDIEADLGIDSIKRLEIFSSLDEAFPNAAANVELNDLAELKTLQEIIDYFHQHASSADPSGNAAAPAGQAHQDTDITVEVFIKTLLSIVTDQTGYPEDMLELDMDIEADLGIDSIKRLEIFSSLDEAFPNASADVELSDLAELKTLQEVVDFFYQTASGSDNTAVLQGDDKTVREEDGHTALEEKSGGGMSTRYIVSPVAVDLPQRTHLKMPPDEQILIIDDGDQTGIHIKQALSGKGHKTTVVQFNDFGSGAKDQADICVDLHDLNDKAIQALLDGIIEKNGPIGGFIHINPLMTAHDDVGDFFNAKENALLKTVFFMAKHLKARMDPAADDRHRFFVTVTRIDGKIGLNGIPSRSILQGGYYGLTKSLKKEVPHLFCRTIDIGPGVPPADITAIVLEELQDSDGVHLEVGRTAHGQRFILDKEMSAQKVNGNGAAGPDRHTVFLVSGGGRGVTARCLEGLAASCQSKFIIVGRTAIDRQEPSWADGIDDDRRLKRAILDNLQQSGKKPAPKKVEAQLKTILNRREILQTLDNISNAGGEAVYIDADITNKAQVKAKIKQAVDRLGPITGIIHGAGNLADKPLEKKTEADYDLVFQTKVKGLKTLLDCATLSQIRCVVLFSSVSGFLGQMGQADYSLANEILNKFSHAMARRYPDALIRSINWGPWDGGMVTPLLKRIYKQFDIDVISIPQGVKQFVDELADDKTENNQVIICSEGLFQMDAKIKDGNFSVDAVNLSAEPKE